MSDTNVAPATSAGWTAHGTEKLSPPAELPIKAAKLLEYLVARLVVDGPWVREDVAAAHGLLTNANLSGMGCLLSAMIELQRQELSLLGAIVAELKQLNASMDLDDDTVDALAKAAGVGEVPVA